MYLKHYLLVIVCVSLFTSLHGKPKELMGDTKRYGFGTTCPYFGWINCSHRKEKPVGNKREIGSSGSNVDIQDLKLFRRVVLEQILTGKSHKLSEVEAMLDDVLKDLNY